jgi:D-3-phosphoglycerate dehydrogenase / 2-oxoglutarate reductase
MMRVLLTDFTWEAPVVERATYGAAGHELVVAPAGDEASLCAAAEGCAAITTCYAKVTARVIEAAGPGLTHVARYGVGVDNIDIAAATARGVLVTNVPDYCIDEVSDQAVAMMLDLGRRTTALDRSMRAGAWAPQAAGLIYRLRGRTCGVIGLGRIGSATAAKAAAFGLRVIAHDPYLTPEQAAARGARLVDLPTLLAESDYISIHAPLTEETRHIVNQETLAQMKPTTYLVNTARGPLVDNDALVAALREGRIAGAGLDVQEGEPLPTTHPLYALDNVLLTPHVAFYSEESLVDLQRRVAEEVVRVLAGEPPRNPVNQ